MNERRGVKTGGTAPRNMPAAFGGGAVIGILGGLIGLGGAEFRLPLLIGLFRFAALEAVILNKAVSLVVVASALPFRAGSVPFAEIAANWPIVVNLLAGSLAGASLGAGWATRLRSETLYRVLAVLLVLIAGVLLLVTRNHSSYHCLTYMRRRCDCGACGGRGGSERRGANLSGSTGSATQGGAIAFGPMPYDPTLCGRAAKQRSRCSARSP